MAKERDVHVTFKVINRDFNSKVKSMSTELKALRSETALNNANFAAVGKSGSSVSARFEYLKNKSRILNDELSIAKRKSEEAHKAYDKLAESGTATAEEMNKMKTQVNYADAELMRAQTAANKAAKEFSGFNKAAAHLSNFGAAADKIADKVKGISMAAGGVIIATSKMASDYQNSMNKVNTIAKLNGREYNTLSRQLLGVSTATGKSAKETAEAAYQALSASVPTDKLVSFTKTATNLSKAGFTTTANSVDLLTTVMNSYGKSAGTASDIANRLIVVQNDGKTTVDELSQSMGGVISTAKTYGVNLDNISAAYISLTKQGINTAKSTTGINSMLNELGSSSKKTGKVLEKETGKSFSELMRSGMSLRDVLEILYRHVGKSSDRMKALFGNANAGKTAMSLLGQSTSEYNSELNKLKNSQGTVNDALKKLDSPSARANRALNAMKNAGISVGQSFLTIATPAIKSFSTWAQKLAAYTDRMTDSEKRLVAGSLIGVASLYEVAKVTAGVANTASKVITIFTKLNGIIRGTSVAMGGAQTASGALAGAGGLGAVLPVAIPVIAAIGAVGAAIYLSKKRYDENTKSLNSLCDRMDKARSQAASLRDQIDASNTSYKKNITSTRDNAAVAQAMAKRVETLANKEHKSAEEKAKLALMVKELNGIMPGLNASYDSQKDKLNMTTDAIYKKIEALKQQAIAEQTAAQSAKIEMQQSQLSVSLANQKNAYDAAKNKYNANQSKIKQVESEYDVNMAKYGAGSYQANQSYRELSKYSQRAQKLKKSMDSLSSSMTKTKNKMSELSRKSNSLSFTTAITSAKRAGKKIPQSLVTGIKATFHVLPKTGTQMGNLIKYTKAINAAKKAGIKIPRSLANGMMTGKAKPAKVQSTINALIDRKARSQAAKQRANGGRMSTQMASGISSKSGTVSKAAGSVSKKAVQSMKKNANAQSVGTFTISGVISGMRKKAGSLFSTASSIAGKIATKFRHVLDIRSPSRVMMKIGGYTVEGFNLGMKKNAQKAYKRAENIAKNTYKTFKKQTEKSTKDYIKDSKKINEKLNDQIKAIKNNYNSAVTSKWESLRGQYTAYDAVSLNHTNYTKQDIIANAKEQAKTAEEYYKTLSKLRSRLGAKTYLYNELKEQGMTALPTLETIAQMSNSELKAYKKAYDARNAYTKKEAIAEEAQAKEKEKKDIAKAKANAKKSQSELRKTYIAEITKTGNTAKEKAKKIGINLNAGIREGIRLSEKTTTKHLTSVMGRYVKAIKKKLKIHSPSRVARDEIGRMFMAGIGLGFEDQAAIESERMTNVLGDMTTTLQQNLQPIGIYSQIENAIKNIMVNVNVNAEMDGEKITKKVSHRQGIELRKKGAK